MFSRRSSRLTVQCRGKLAWIEFDCMTQLPMCEWGWRWCWYEPGLCFDKHGDGWISFVLRKVCWTVLMQHAIISKADIQNFPEHAQKRWLYPQQSVMPLNLSSQCPRRSFESTIPRVCCRLGKTANEAVKLPGLAALVAVPRKLKSDPSFCTSISCGVFANCNIFWFLLVWYFFVILVHHWQIWII